MKTIDTCIQEFLATLQHTPGPWETDESTKHVQIYNHIGTLIVDRIATRERLPNYDRGKFSVKELANSKLISSSPCMLSTLCYTYLTLLVKFAYGQNSTCNEIRISLDSTLADLRNSICTATDIDCEVLQTTFENYVKEIAN